MRIAHAPSQLERRPRAVAIGTFDGVHRGHRSVLRAAIDSGLEPTVITLDPHPRIVLGNRVDLISTLERRLELLAEAGVADTMVAACFASRRKKEPANASELMEMSSKRSRERGTTSIHSCVTRRL